MIEMLSPAEFSAGATKPPATGSAPMTLLVVAISIVALYLGRDILIPVALAILLSFALGPIAIRLRRWGLGRVTSVVIVVLLAFVGLGGFGVLIGGQLVQLVKNLPAYQYNIHTKIRSMQSAARDDGMIDRAVTVLRELSKDVSGESRAGTNRAADVPSERTAIPVRIEEPDVSMFAIIAGIASPLLGPIGTAGLVVVFVFLMLVEREDLRTRLIKLVGGGNLYLTTEALDDAAQRVSRYLLMQLIVNVTYGVPLGIGLYFIGVPNALLWGVLATVLRFVPYVGPFTASLFPIALAIAVDPGWEMLLWTIGLFLTVELISNNVIEPWLYGASTGVSAIAIILAAIFWTTLWGPIGLLLSTPLTVCLVVMGRYIPHLRFLEVMLGSEPALSAGEHFYQRMLAGDSEEGEEIAKEQLKEHTLPNLYHEMILPALCLAERDRDRKFLVGERRAVVTESFLRVVTSLSGHECGKASSDAADGFPRDLPDSPRSPGAISPVWRGKSVLCIAGWTGLDRVAAAILAQQLEFAGIGARALPADGIISDRASNLDIEGVELICLVYLSKSGSMHARQACLRVGRQAPSAKIMVALLNGHEATRNEGDQNPALSCGFIATSLAQAFDLIKDLAASPIVTPMVPAPVPREEPERLDQLKKLKILDTETEEVFDRLTRRLAQAFGAPIALLSLIDEYRQFWKSATGMPEDLNLAREAPRETSICGHVVAANQLLVVEDVLKDKRFANNPFLRERGIRFYAGAPLRTSTGHAIGSLCVIDTKPRSVSERESKLLQMIADETTAQIENRKPSHDALRQLHESCGGDLQHGTLLHRGV